jgi:hypothetical protein
VKLKNQFNSVFYAIQSDFMYTNFVCDLFVLKPEGQMYDQPKAAKYGGAGIT